MRPAKLLLVCALLLVGPSGCMTWFTDPMGYHATFDRQQRQYTNYLRWGEVEKASNFVDPKQREAFLKQVPIFERMRITDYDIGEVDYLDDHATVTVTYAGYSLDTFVEHKIRENQQWYREDATGGWHVRSDMAALTQSLEGAQR
jgi:hypothetical protein